MRKDIMIGLGAVLATFAVSVTEASASCNWGRRACRAYRPPPVYTYAPPPPAYGQVPQVKVFVYVPPQAPYNGYGPSDVGYYPTAPYYGPPPYYENGYRGYGGYGYARPVYNGNGYPGYGYGPPAYYDAYRPASVWIQVR